jgi:hypothetical protein
MITQDLKNTCWAKSDPPWIIVLEENEENRLLNLSYSYTFVVPGGVKHFPFHTHSAGTDRGVEERSRGRRGTGEFRGVKKRGVEVRGGAASKR